MIKYVTPNVSSDEIETLRNEGYQLVFDFEPQVDKIILSTDRRKAVIHYVGIESKRVTDLNGNIDRLIELLRKVG